jgi:hypothetical protein
MKKIWLKPKWHWIKYQQAKACCKTENIFKMDYHLLQLVEANQQATEQLLKALLHQAFLPAAAATQAGEIKENEEHLAKA